MRIAISACLALAVAGPARADGGPRIAVVVEDPELVATLTSALAPWEATVVVVEGVGPGHTMPGSATRGRALARARAAQAVVWMSESPDGWAVWVYDAAEDRAMARPIAAAPPFDEPTAAAIALSVMTLLRYSAVAPRRERMRAPPSEAPRLVRIELAGGAEGWSTAPDRVEPRFALALSYWPTVWHGRVGLGTAIRAGPGVAVERNGLAARLFDARFAIRAHVRTTIGDHVVLGGVLGAGVRITSLDGSIARTTEVHELRTAGVLELAAEMGLDLDPLLLCLRVGAFATAWLHHYEIAGDLVIASELVWPFAELGIELGFR